MQMDNQEEQRGAADPFEESLRQILSNDSVQSGRPAASLAGASNPIKNMSSAERRAADDAAAAAKRLTERKTLFWLNILRPLAAIGVIVLLWLFVMRTTSGGG
jgi:hypothetical protein